MTDAVSGTFPQENAFAMPVPSVCFPGTHVTHLTHLTFLTQLTWSTLLAAARCQPHDRFLGQLITAQLSCQTALMHDQRSIAHPQDFLHVTAHEEDGDSAPGQLLHQ